MLFNDAWFDDPARHQLFVVVHEFRHTMFVNTLYQNVKLPGPPGTWSDGYEKLPSSNVKVTSRNGEGEARRWASNLVGHYGTS